MAMKLQIIKISIWAVCFLSFLGSRAQEEYADSSYFAPLIQMSYAYQIPGADMAVRFGNNSSLGLQTNIKFKNYWTLGLKSTFFWGSQVNHDSLLKGTETSGAQGKNYVNVIDRDGELARIYFEERGFTVMATAGRIFNVLAPNKNSGIMIHGGVGAMWHRIRIDYRNSKIQWLDKPGRRGYDHLSVGPAVEGFLGYVFLSRNRYVNFFAGVEFQMAWTRNVRGYNYDTMAPDNKIRTDQLLGFRAGWILPLYKAKPKEFYYY